MSRSSPSPAPHRGRFAPSPTGPLHFGSLIAALGSYLQARARGGEWLVRIEDIDPPREERGAAGLILRTLEALGLHWDGAVTYQSKHEAYFEQALAQLQAAGHTYPCVCTRREILAAAGPESVKGQGPIYPGTCRNGPPHDRPDRATRVRTHDEPIGFVDALQGPLQQVLSRDSGDFVVHRREGKFCTEPCSSCVTSPHGL